jgi:hypothetical protein
MNVDKQTAIQLATTRIVAIYPDARFIRTKEIDNLRRLEGTDNLPKLEGRCGWCIDFHVVDDLFGPYDRPVLVDGDTGEVTIVKLLL